MPQVFRPMIVNEQDGLPLVGTESKRLGVRVPPNPHADVASVGSVQVKSSQRTAQIITARPTIPATKVTKSG